MSKFGYLNKLDISAATAEYPIDEIELDGKCPVLIVKSTSDSNKGYFNAVARRALENNKKRVKVTIETLEETRDLDRELFPKHVVVGWKNVIASNGDPVEFSSEEVAEFLNELPNWIFDRVRTFCGDPSNFIEGGHVSVEGVEETAKN